MSPFKVRFKFVRQGSRILAIAAVALVAAGVAIAVGHPQEVAEPILGNEWQCSRTVLLVTTCVPVGEQNGSLPNDAALRSESTRLNSSHQHRSRMPSSA